MRGLLSAMVWIAGKAMTPGSAGLRRCTGRSVINGMTDSLTLDGLSAWCAWQRKPADGDCYPDQRIAVRRSSVQGRTQFLRHSLEPLRVGRRSEILGESADRNGSGIEQE